MRKEDVDFEPEVRALAARFGDPLRREAAITGHFDPVDNPARAGEVCMVVRRPGGTLLLSIKTFYPREGWRLPTGGIDLGESIEAAVVRETLEETGLETRLERFLAAIAYRREGDARPPFHTFAFLLTELAGTLGPLDLHEQLEAYREIEVDELPLVAARLDSIGRAGAAEIGGDWAEWGRFRAHVHRAVHDALRG